MSESNPDPVDIYVGSRLRMRRLMLGLSQEKLASAIGLTFQQIQKYEKGTNRIGASRLFQLANALSTNVQYFYENIQSADRDNEDAREVLTLLASPDGMRLCQYFSEINNAQVRRKLLDLVQTLAEQQTVSSNSGAVRDHRSAVH